MRISTSHRAGTGAGGYLLLEVVLALGVASLVLYGVFAIADGSMKLANSVAEDGKDTITHEAFISFMGRNFEELPGNAVLNLTLEDGGNVWLSDLTFQNVPTAFSWAGQTLSAEAVQLSTVRRRHGNLDIVLRYYDVPILDDSDSTADVTAEPVAELTLLRDVHWFEWYAIDGRTMEATDTWDIPGRLPLQLKLDVKYSVNEDRIVHYFWIPPKVNPETIVRSQRRSAPQQPGDGRGGQNDEEGGPRRGDDDRRGQGDGQRGGDQDRRGGNDRRGGDDGGANRRSPPPIPGRGG